MKTGMLLFILFLPLSVQAFTPVKSGAYITASNVAKGGDIQCAGTSTTDASGNPQVVVTDCVVRMAITENQTVMNYCFRFASYDLLTAALDKIVSLYDLAYATKSTVWTWFPQMQAAPDGVDVRCTQ